MSSVAQTDLAGAVGGGAEDALLLLCRTILVDGDLGGDPRDERAEAMDTLLRRNEEMPHKYTDEFVKNTWE
mgnify:CR=1 FL=1